MSVILALANLQIVGCLDSGLYEGAEYPWPNGWAELLAQGVRFDQVEIELPTPEMATAYIEHFKPKGNSQA